MKRIGGIILGLAIVLMASYMLAAPSAAPQTATELMNAMMDSAEAYGAEVYDREPSTAEKSDNEFGTHLKSTYILYSGVYAVTRADAASNELLSVCLFADIPLLAKSIDGVEVCGFYMGTLLQELEGRSAGKIADALEMDGLNMFSTFVTEVDGSDGHYVFTLVGGESISIEYTALRGI